MTRKFAWWWAFGFAATALLTSGAQAEAVRLTASEDDIGWQDDVGKVRPSPVYFTEEPPPPPPRLKPKQGVGAGAESLSSPSDVKQPMKLVPKAAPVEGPVQGTGPVQGVAPLQKDGYVPLQKAGDAPVQHEYANPLQKSGDGYHGDSCGVDAGCGVNYAPSCGNESGCGYAAPSCGCESAPSCGYDNSCYGDCFCPSSCCSRWAFRAEALFWERSDGSEQVIASAPGGATINANGYDFNRAAGPRLSLFYRGFMDSCWDLELTYFGIHGWNETQTLAGATTLGTVPPINFGASTVTSTYSSRLDSSEMNFRRKWSNWLTFIAGTRWIEEAEDLSNDIGGAAGHNIDVNNHLYGGQIGLEALLWNRCGPWSVEGVTKFGVYYIDSDVTTTTAGVLGALPTVFAQSNDTAFTADLGVTAIYQMTSCADLRFGYNLFWIDGIAEAPAQMGTTNIATGVATVNMDSTQLYHGFSVGVEIRR